MGVPHSPPADTEMSVMSEEPDFVPHSEEESERERKLRLEAALKMRDMFVEKQKQWAQFREAERQRRIDKANQEELHHLAAVLASSRVRHELTKAKFHQTLTVRSHYDAALIIQRAYRKMKKQRKLLRVRETVITTMRKKKENGAAIIIQRAWRRYRQLKLYEFLHFKSIPTGPVLSSLRSHPQSVAISGSVQPLYQKGTSITGAGCFQYVAANGNYSTRALDIYSVEYSVLQLVSTCS